MPYSLRHIRAAVLGGFALLVSASTNGCGSDHLPYYYPVGPCGSDLECPFGGYCIEPNPGSCLAPCRGNIDCPVQYTCKSRDRRGVDGKVSVCVPH
jgi:hypothetical protein